MSGRLVRTALCWAVLLFAAPVHSESLPSEVGVGGQTLVVAKCGVTEVLFFADVFAAGLYLPRGSSAADALADPARPKELRIAIRNGSLIPSQMSEEWRRSFASTMSAEAMDEVSHAYRQLRTGDLVVLTYQPQHGTSLRVNDRVIVTGQSVRVLVQLVEALDDAEGPQVRFDGTCRS